MSAGDDLWNAIHEALEGNAGLMAMVDGVHDKVPKDPWRSKQVYVSRGPFSGTAEDAECIPGQELAAQIDVWSRRPSRWSVDRVIGVIRDVLHEAYLPLASGTLATMHVRMWRVTDDPDPNQQHGIVQILAIVEDAV